MEPAAEPIMKRHMTNGCLLQQVFAECTQARNTTGLSNPGISSRIARVMHKKQGIYDSAGEM